MKLIQTVDDPGVHYLTIRQDDHVVSFMRGDLLFIINFSPSQTQTDYVLPAVGGTYRVAHSSDDQHFGGHGRVQQDQRYFTTPGPQGDNVRVYLPARSGLVLCRID